MGIQQTEIPQTINHAQLKREIYNEWAAMHQCRVSETNADGLCRPQGRPVFQSSHGRDNMELYIRTAILGNIFGLDNFLNKIPNYVNIVYSELVQEYETHILPAIMRRCREYLYRLPFTRPNMNFESFNRENSPVPIPPTEEGQRASIDKFADDFNAYSMPFRVETGIRYFEQNRTTVRPWLPPSTVHSQSRILLFMIRHDKYR